MPLEDNSASYRNSRTLKKKNSSINLPVIYTKDKPQQEAEMYGYDHAGKCDPGGGWCVCTSADTTENEPLPVD